MDLFNNPMVLILLAFLLGCLLARIMPEVLAFALAGLAISSRIFAAGNTAYIVYLVYFALALAAYLTGNAFPWRRLEIIRGKMYKLFFSVALAYGLLLGLVSLLFWWLGWLETLRPWLIYFTLAFGLISYREPWKRMLSMSVRGPMSLVLQQLSALSAFVTLAVLSVTLEYQGVLPILRNMLYALIFFCLWLGFIRCAKLSPASMLSRGLQFGFLYWLVASAGNFSFIAGALTLGLANALTGIKILDARSKLDLWKMLTATVFILICGLQQLEFSWFILGVAVLIWLLRFALFYLYNLLAYICLFGRDFVRRSNFGLQISDCLLVLFAFLLQEPQILSVFVLVVIIEQLLYPILLKHVLVQSGETES